MDNYYIILDDFTIFSQFCQYLELNAKERWPERNPLATISIILFKKF